MQQLIAHLDMDAFFAAVEERDNPQFQGLGIVVGADPKNGLGRGVVSTANYQARKYGIHSAMPISVAWRLAQVAQRKGMPKTIFLPVNISYYTQVSQKIFAIVRKYVSLVEETSIDEAYLDFSFCFLKSRFGNLSNQSNFQDLSEEELERAYEKAVEIIKKIKQEIKEKEKLTASVGLGPNKLIAKIASGKAKPDGLKVVKPKEVESFLSPLPIGDIPGIGPKLEEFFHKKKIFKVGELRKISQEELVGWLGKWGREIWEKAWGRDEAKIEEKREIKSISEQETFEKDTLSPAFLLSKLDNLVTKVIERMREEGIKQFRTVTIVVRFADFTTKTRSHTFKNPTDSLTFLKNETIKMLLPFLDRRGNPKRQLIRLLGVGISGFQNKEIRPAKETPEARFTQESLF